MPVRRCRRFGGRLGGLPGSGNAVPRSPRRSLRIISIVYVTRRSKQVENIRTNTLRLFVFFPPLRFRMSTCLEKTRFFFQTKFLHENRIEKLRYRRYFA